VASKYDWVFDFWNGMAEGIQSPRSEDAVEVHTMINIAGVPIALGKRWLPLL